MPFLLWMANTSKIRIKENFLKNRFAMSKTFKRNQKCPFLCHKPSNTYVMFKSNLKVTNQQRNKSLSNGDKIVLAEII
jgi:hypothetical protein